MIDILVNNKIYSLALSLFLCITLIGCQKELNLKSEVVLIGKELIIDYQVLLKGNHTFTLYRTMDDLEEDVNIIQTQSKLIIANEGHFSIMFDPIQENMVYVKLSINNNVASIGTYKYQQQIVFPNYNGILNWKINSYEWIPI